MRGAGQWGGAIEIAIFAHTNRVGVCVYEPNPGGGHRRISTFGDLASAKVLHLLYGGHISPYLPTSPPDLSISPQVLHLLYGGRVHYDALVLPSAL